MLGGWDSFFLGGKHLYSVQTWGWRTNVRALGVRGRYLKFHTSSNQSRCQLCSSWWLLEMPFISRVCSSGRWQGPSLFIAWAHPHRRLSFYYHFLLLGILHPCRSFPFNSAIPVPIPLPLWFHQLWSKKVFWKNESRFMFDQSACCCYCPVLLWIIVSYALWCLIYNIGVITGKYGDNETVHSGCVFSTLPGIHWGSSGMKVGSLHCLLNHPFRSKAINN